jgi:hypothetical protein
VFNPGCLVHLVDKFLFIHSRVSLVRCHVLLFLSIARENAIGQINQ